MDVVVSLECRFDRTPDGKVWQQTQFPYQFWTRYLEVFDNVKVVARVRDVQEVPDNWLRCDGDRVSFVPIPYYIGPWQYLRKAGQVKKAVREAIRPEDAVIMRVYSNLGRCMLPQLRATSHPYAVEMVSDPYYLFAPGANHHPLRPFFRWFFTAITQRHCRDAIAASYVTKAALQRRYPCPGYMESYSSIQLRPGDFVATPRSAEQFQAKPLTLIHVGTLEQLYKAQDVLIEAVAVCLKEGLDLRLELVGEGQHRAELEQRVVALGLTGRIRFIGQLTNGVAVRNQLDQADLFVLPSRQEGLPRAMIEAQARGLPCIGSNVNGIPELLQPEDMVEAGDIKGLASKIREVVTDPERMARMSARNLEVAHEYEEDILKERRRSFYSYVSDKTREWQTRGLVAAQAHS